MNITHSTRNNPRAGLMAITAAALVATCTGCGAISRPGDAASAADGAAIAPAATANSAAPLADRLPAAIRKKGYVTVATDPTYPPFETLSSDQHTIVGLDPEILQAIAHQLGIKTKFRQAGFDSIVPGLQAKRYDMAMSGMTDTTQREKQVRFVDYFTVGGGILMAKGDPAAKQPMTQGLCGKKVAVGVGTIIAKLSKKASAQCLNDGKPAIQLRNYPSVSAAVLGLSAQRIGYVWTDSVSAATQAEKSKGQFVSVSDGTPAEPSGIAFPKGSTQLCEAFRAGLQAIIDNGTYDRVLAKYGLTSGAVKKAVVNGAID